MPGIATQFGYLEGALAEGITAHFPEDQWVHAAEIAYLESRWDVYAVNDSALDWVRHGTAPPPVNGVPSSPELSCGPFQINVVVHAYERWPTLFDPFINAWAAHQVWLRQGWGAWYHSARALGLIPR